MDALIVTLPLTGISTTPVSLVPTYDNIAGGPALVVCAIFRSSLPIAIYIAPVAAVGIIYSGQSGEKGTRVSSALGRLT